MNDKARREEFYRERDRRTVEYGGLPAALNRTVDLVVGHDAAESVAGQVCAVAAINMLARVHRRIHVVVPDVRLVVRAPFVEGRRLRDALIETAQAIDPFGEFDSCAVPNDGIRLGIGSRITTSCDFYVGAMNATASIDMEPQAMWNSSGTRLGAALAACLGVAAVFKVAHKMPSGSVRLSAWDFRTVPGESGPSDLGQVAVGSVAMIGAGAVGSALAYWLRAFGVVGLWQIVDHDSVELHNTNRGLGMLPMHAGWTSGVRQKKAMIAADLFGAVVHAISYEEWIETPHVSYPELLLPLANGPGFRAAVNRRGERVLVHATTSRSWQSQLHRHIAHRDACLECRIPANGEATFRCSEGSLPTPLGSSRKNSSDAALPFLSAAAGVMLVAALYRMQAGEFLQLPDNFWALDFRSKRRQVFSARENCSAGCNRQVPEDVSRRIESRRLKAAR
jgi:hypothetical protein